MAQTKLGALLRHRTLSKVWLSQVASNSGDFVFLVAIQWYILTSTGSILDVGIAVATALLPNVLVAPWAGVVVDRFDRRSVVAASYAVQGGVVGLAGGLFVLHFLGYVAALLLILGLEVGHQFTGPANSALIASSVPPDDLVAANGVLSSSGSANQLGSSALGGLLLAAFGLALPLEYDALSFVVGLVLIALVPAGVGAPSRGAEGPTAAAPPGWWQDLREGFDYLRKDRLMRQIAVLGLVVSFFPMGLQGLYAPYVQHVLSGSAADFGFFEASFAFGSLAGGLAMVGTGSRWRAGRLLLVGLLGQAVMVAGLGANHLLLVAFGLGALGGAAQAVTGVAAQAVQQAKLPRRVFGRVSTLLSAITNGPAPLFIFLTAALATWISVSTTYLIYGVAFLVSVALGFVLSRDIRELRLEGPTATEPS
jgi:MFS transporter, DHA3 family, macrolide efflux protein